MKKEFKLFYSWQSDIGGHNNRSYIRQVIDKYVKTKETDFYIIVEEDSRGIPGASSIADEIFKKITNCDIFICDVTPIFQFTKEDSSVKDIPNPNVMFELGFAVRHLGWKRIVLVLNDNFGKPENVPFDIAGHSIVRYNRKDGNSIKSLDITASLDKIIDKYSEIIDEGNEYNYTRHDIQIYDKLRSLYSEEEFINSLKDFRDSSQYTSWDDKIWDHFRFYLNLPQNSFINPELNEKLKEVSEAISELHSKTAAIVFAIDDPGWMCQDPTVSYSKDEIQKILRSQIYRLRKLSYPAGGEEEDIRKYFDQSDEDERTVYEVCNNVIAAYDKFRQAVKRILVV